jgi:hypothetical protein
VVGVALRRRSRRVEDRRAAGGVRGRYRHRRAGAPKP